MKSILSIILLFFSVISFAQKETLTSGTILFDISYTALDESLEEVAQMFNGSTMNVAYTSDFTYFEMKMNSILEIKALTDYKKDNMKMVMNISGNKTAVDCQISEIDQPNTSKKYDIEDTGETKKILGYNCKKYKVLDKDDNETELWATTEIVVDTKGQTTLRSFDIEGFPLDYALVENGFQIRFKVNSISDKVDKKLLTLKIPKSCNMMTAEQINDANAQQELQNEKEENTEEEQESEEEEEEEK